MKLNFQINDEQLRVTDNDLIEIKADWQIKTGQQINLEKVLCAGSVDFTLIGRPILPRSTVTVMATCVQGKPVLNFKLKINSVLFI